MRKQQKISLVYAVFTATGQSFSSLYSYCVYIFLEFEVFHAVKPGQRILMC